MIMILVVKQKLFPIYLYCVVSLNGSDHKGTRNNVLWNIVLIFKLLKSPNFTYICISRNFI